MKIKIPKIAYGSLDPKYKGKWHLASNVNPEGTECFGPKTVCDLDELELFQDTQNISKIGLEKRCLKCFAAFILN